jgi:hypothetical protein
MACQEEKGRLKFIIPFKTPTYNHLYWHRGNMKIMKKEARILREKIISDIQIQCDDQEYCLSDWENQKLKVIVNIHENWFTKKGDIKRTDISNREKFVIDSLFEALGLDDKCVWSHTMNKIQKVNPEEIKSIIWVEKVASQTS